MQCERARGLLSPYLDGELSPRERRAMEGHIEGCASCAGGLAELRRIGETIAGAGREPMPAALIGSVRAALAQADAAEVRGRRPGRILADAVRRLSARALVRQAAAIAAACAVTALATWWLATASLIEGGLEREVMTAHVRSLLQESPTQVASSDAHTVKPWFAGRLDFSPDVKDLTAEGFALLGGRLDYVDGRRVAALVYRRRLHTINVFVWADAANVAVAPRRVTRKGYNLLTWSRHGLVYWAVSDLNAEELRQLEALL